MLLNRGLPVPCEAEGERLLRAGLSLRGLLEPVDAAVRLPGAAPDEPAVCAMYRGDLTLDGATDGEDLSAFLAAWTNGDLVAADLDRDGAITQADLAIVMADFLLPATGLDALFR